MVTIGKPRIFIKRQTQPTSRKENRLITNMKHLQGCDNDHLPNRTELLPHCVILDWNKLTSQSSSGPRPTRSINKFNNRGSKKSGTCAINGDWSLAISSFRNAQWRDNCVNDELKRMLQLRVRVRYGSVEETPSPVGNRVLSVRPKQVTDWAIQSLVCMDASCMYTCVRCTSCTS
jgi:hypothetical protein